MKIDSGPESGSHDFEIRASAPVAQFGATMRFEDREIGYEVLAVPSGQGTAVTFVLTEGGAQSTHEVRFLAIPFPEMGLEEFTHLASEWRPRHAHAGLMSQDIRVFSLGHALAELRSNQQASETEYRESDIPNPAVVIRTANGQALGFRTTRDFSAAIARVSAAVAYVSAVRRNDPTPAIAVARTMNKTTEQARALLAQARKAGYLQSVGKGVSGGSLTAKGTELWTALLDLREAKPEGQS